jgi:hypothetical protein
MAHGGLRNWYLESHRQGWAKGEMHMNMERAILLTIITERVLEPTLKEVVERAGAQGYTIEDVESGWGTHGWRTGPHESDQNFKMLLIVSEPVAQVILHEIARTLHKSYAIAVFQHEVAVLSRMPVLSASGVR